MFNEYSIILVGLVISFCLGCIIYTLSYLLIQKTTDLEKISIYECGFEPFEQARNVFEVKFYLVAILFVIFDLEVTYLFPWLLVISIIGYSGLISLFLFLLLLLLVYIYEWLLGALEW